jgi:hypothetical protein
MKKFALLIFTLVFLTGFALADTGLNPVPETPGYCYLHVHERGR